MADKDKLRNMLDNIIGDNSEQAQVDFHDYLSAKMREVINPESAEVDTENNEE